MTPLQDPQAGPTALPCPVPPAVPGYAKPAIAILTHRADFLRAAQARRQSTPGFLLQARQRAASERASGIRVGYTCSKKLGNAVARNHAKRRLREIARAVLPGLGRPGWDYVLIGRPSVTSSREFALLLSDLDRAIGQIHRSGS